LRCPKCQNQNLADSNSILSLDLKDIIVEKLKKGETNSSILYFMKQRYGEFILFDPELTQENGLLWMAPLIFFGILVLFLIFWYKKNYTNSLHTPSIRDDSC
jgi:cytochrome c-type biogenesis protein CcmH